ncbi:dehydrodolichyl diphosphate synthase 6-like [Pyrus ussuriensis x Pyrus communis]|uniref:Alkyl transferase n=1 Tax=Pyrus ussuriensis x Pyrus communis TaxID=2448454 RepID=A0A5N5GRL5_9ROSA|nr:dehydrodolichyl diphosphate synthase 6-like [Pyrus ussuriensis x Pyrus communis]
MTEENSAIVASQSSAIGASQSLGALGSFLRKCLFSAVSVGPIPEHIAFIMDGNRRYAKKRNLPAGEGHRAGFLSFMSVLRYCYELLVKYVTVSAFGTDNFKRPSDEVQILMDLLQEQIEGLLERESIVNQYGIRVYFIGNLKLLNESVRDAAEKATKATVNNSKAVLLICVAYSSRDEIVHAVQESSYEKRNEIQAQIKRTRGGNGGLDGEAGLDTSEACNERVEGEKKENTMVKHVEKDEGEIQESGKQLQNVPVVKVVDVERHMYVAVAPDPNIVIRTSGETRLSKFSALANF